MADGKNPVKPSKGYVQSLRKLASLKAKKTPWFGRIQTAQREFNRLKNAFYKEEKKAQRVNFEKKRALIELAESVKDSDDFAELRKFLKKHSRIGRSRLCSEKRGR